MTISFNFNGSMEIKGAEVESSAEEVEKMLYELLCSEASTDSVICISVSNYKVRKDNK